MIFHVSPSSKRPMVSVAADTRFSFIRPQFAGACLAMWLVCEPKGIVPVVTGAGVEPVYAHEPLHLSGYAWDFRCSYFGDADKAFQELVEFLHSIDPRYRAVQFKAPKPAHFHIEWNGPQ